MVFASLRPALVGAGLLFVAGCTTSRQTYPSIPDAQSLRSVPSTSSGSSEAFARRSYVPARSRSRLGENASPIGVSPSRFGVGGSRLRRGSMPNLLAPDGIWQEAGRSVEGRPIETIRLGTGSDRVLLIGSVHGNEDEGVELVERFVEHLQQNPSLLRGRTVLVVRDANPDGNAAGTRTNANGVDLNRNFPASNWKGLSKNGRPASGEYPQSEPETRLIVELVESFNPHRIVVVHSTGGGKAMVNYDGPAAELARAMARKNGYEVTDYIGYPTPGSFGSYAGIDRNLPIITLELRRGQSDRQAWQENRDALIAAVQFGRSGFGQQEHWAK